MTRLHSFLSGAAGLPTETQSRLDGLRQFALIFVMARKFMLEQKLQAFRPAPVADPPVWGGGHQPASRTAGSCGRPAGQRAGLLRTRGRRLPRTSETGQGPRDAGWSIQWLLVAASYVSPLLSCFPGVLTFPCLRISASVLGPRVRLSTSGSLSLSPARVFLCCSATTYLLQISFAISEAL